MKIPDAPAPANLAPYYGNEENGQWQPNGVIIDSGVGGGVVGSGDAGVHRPPVYPVHIPRGHVPGYVMAGAYFPPAYPPAPPAPQDDFADYMWMENEEEFDKQVMQQLEEEALMEQCIEAMLEDQQRERTEPAANGHNNPTTSNGTSSLSLEETVSRSTLNPLAAEFVPTRRPPPQPQLQPEPQVQPPTAIDDKPEATDTPSSAESPSGAELTEVVREEAGVSTSEVDGRKEESETDVSESTPPPADPPEVSAADVQPIADKALDKRPKEERSVRKEIKARPQEIKKTAKQDTKKVTKPAPVKSETKVQTPVKKKEVKQVKSESRVERVEQAEDKSPVEEVAVSVADTGKQTSSPPPEDSALSGPKPINYAAAAKANKPKKPSSPPITDKSTPPPMKTEKNVPVAIKPEKTKTVTKTVKDKPIQRKNSTK